MKNSAKNELAIVRILNIPQACPENKVQTSDKMSNFEFKKMLSSFLYNR